MLGETYKNAVYMSLGSAVYAHKTFGTTFAVTDGKYLRIGNEREDEKEMFKVDTVEQYKILQFIKQHFDMKYITIKKNSRDCLRVTDQGGDSLTFKLENGKVIWQESEAHKKKAVPEVPVQIQSKDLYCMAWHLQSFLEDAKNDAIADFGKPCETCKYARRCDFDFYSKTAELTKLTGVRFSAFKNI